MPQSSEDHHAHSHTVEPASMAHKAPMAEIHAQCFAKGWAARDFEQFLGKPDIYKGFIAHSRDDHVSGFVWASCQADEAEILTLCVRPQDRRAGAAKKLMQHLLVILRAEKTASVFLEVSQENMAALNLYEDLGFERVGLRPHYSRGLDGSISDACVMKLSF